MKRSYATAVLVLVLLSFTLSGCRSASALMESKRLDFTYGPPHRLLVFADLGNIIIERADGDQEKVFADEFVKSLNSCGIVADYRKKRALNTALTLDDSAKKNDDRGLSGNRFENDAMLDIQWAQQTLNTGLGVIDYRLVLSDSKSGKAVWTGQIHLVAAWHTGPLLTATLVDRLKQDGIVPANCVTPAVPK